MSLKFEDNTIPKIDEKATFGELTYRSNEVIYEAGDNGAPTDISREIRVTFYSTMKKGYVEIVFPVEIEEKIKQVKRKAVIELTGDVRARGWYASKEQSNGFVTAESGLKFLADDFIIKSSQPTSLASKVPQKEEKKENGKDK